jgi:Secretion system C-terminal sorting domain
MKKLLLKSLLLIIFSATISPNTKACDNSSYTLVSFVTTPGPIYTITTQLCIGGGRSGVVFGAGGPTSGFFSVAVWSSAGAGIQAALTGWTINLLPGTALNIPPAMPPGVVAFNANPLFGYGPFGPGFTLGESDNIIYGDPNCGCLDYACIFSTAGCGNVSSFCQNIVLTYAGIYPDSICVLGIEGLAPLGGCGCGTDMGIVLTPPLPVVWGDFSGLPSNDGVNLSWQAQTEPNTNEIVITRAFGHSNAFTEIARIPSNDDGGAHGEYSFFDSSPIRGLNAYKLMQTDENGNRSESKTIYVSYMAPTAMSLEKAFPNPVTENLNVTVSSHKEMMAALSLYNAEGKLMQTREMQLFTGVNDDVLKMTDLSPGIYFLRVTTDEGTIEKKILKY